VNANPPTRKIGLARALSKLGYCSRSQAAEQIRAGRVRLNGLIRKNVETPVHLDKDYIEVDDKLVSHSAKIYLMLNKPRGVVTTACDEKDRRTVYEYLNQQSRWLAPVGRLDKASEGLLLFTNDSEWAAAVLAPETHIPKTYHVQIATLADSSLIAKLLSGVTSDGDILRAKTARIYRQGSRNSWLEIVLDEGKNRQIRRMLQALDVEVLRLLRIAIGPLALGNLPKGGVRELTSEEKEVVDSCISAARRAPSANLSAQRRETATALHVRSRKRQ
jgi:23S rRNA pseudouridine2605 synthase